MNKNLILIFCFLLYTGYLASAQSTWQWGKRGGASDATTSAGHQPDESVYSMATDQAGNIYVLSLVMQTALNVDGHPISDYGGHDILITSFKCDGAYRWSKDLGSYQDDGPGVLKTDTLGGVYVAGYIPAYSMTEHIDADTSWVNTTNQFNFLAKFDTAGNYKWIRHPEPDTIGLSSPSFVLDMDADNAGNTYTLWIMSAGAYAGGAFIVTMPGYYVLKYDKNGNFVSGTPRFDISYTGYYADLRMKRDHQNGRYYITGDIQVAGPSTLSFGGTPIAHGLFIGAFAGSGAFLWEREDKESTIGFGYSFSRPALDAQENIYVTGEAYYFTTPADTFNGYAIINTEAPYGNVPFAVKLDTNGNNTWAINGSATGNTPSAAITVNGNEADIAGSSGMLKWPGYADSLTDPASGGGYNIFITRFNAATGAVIGLDSLASDFGANEFAASMVSDQFGNFYVGGKFASVLYVAGATLNNIGGDFDFFVAKYGTANCSCAALPFMSFTSSGTTPTAFIYTGATTGVDSMLWIFGDGTTGTSFDPYHTYAAADSYHVCAVAYTNCGTDTTCREIHIGSTGITNITSSEVLLYPNPATNDLYIENAGLGTEIKLFDIMGRQVYSSIVTSKKQELGTWSLTAGIYLLQLTDTSGNREMRTIVKE